jgi:hypothetical protein
MAEAALTATTEFTRFARSRSGQVNSQRERLGCVQPESADENVSRDRGEAGAVDFGSFSEERARIDRITARLDVTEDLVERADLGSELVRSASRYEDTVERALLPRLQGSSPDVTAELERDLDELRETMEEIHQRTMGIDPRNVHAADGQGFEDALAVVVVDLRALLEVEDRETAALVESLGSDEREQLVDEIDHAFRSASERPRPPRTAVGRFLSNAHVKLDHTLEDVATPQHPGAETLKG